MLEAAIAAAQPVNAVRLTEGVQPPTRVFPGDEIELTVFDPARFPAQGRWTIGERPVQAGQAAGDDSYRLSFTVPGDFPSRWARLPIVYADPGGQVLYDSRLDARDAVALAGISDLAPFIERLGRVTGASPRAHPGERFCVCGFFPDRRSRQGLRLDDVPLSDPISVSGSQMWFLMPAGATGSHEIRGDPAVGFAPGDRAAIEISEGPAEDVPGPCPCASEFLADGLATGPPAGVGRNPYGESPEPPLLWLESLGGSTGEVFTAHLVSPGSEPIEFDGLFAVEPVSLLPEQRDRILASVRQAAGSHAEVKVNFYCLQFGAAAPPEGVVYRVASPEKQERFQPAARALAAARRLYEANLLSPDTRPESYFHSIRQWTVWTLERGFDREGFISAFVEHAKKNVAEAGEQWSEEFSDAVHRSAEGRWKDITKVLGEAGLEIADAGNT
jgi:hypothetical protein